MSELSVFIAKKLTKEPLHDVKSFNLNDDSVYFIFNRPLENTLIVHISNEEDNNICTFPIFPEVVNAVFEHTKIPYLRFLTSELLIRQSTLQEWRIEVIDYSSKIKIKDITITISKQKIIYK